MTSPNRHFHEKQRFRQWWIWMVMVPGPFMFVWFLWAIIQQIVMNSPVGDNPVNDYVLLILALVVGLIFGLGLPVLIYSAGLDTEVTESGVNIRFRPFHRGWVRFRFDDIKTAEGRTYHPLRDYGGWGIRYGRIGKAYNVSGNKGVLLTFKDGRDLMIGSNDHQSMCSAIIDRLPKDPAAEE